MKEEKEMTRQLAFDTPDEDALKIIHGLFVYYVKEYFKLPLRAVGQRIGLSYQTVNEYLNMKRTPGVKRATVLMDFVDSLISMEKNFLKVIKKGDFTKPHMTQLMRLVYKEWGVSLGRAEFTNILHSDLPEEERARLMVKDLITMSYEAYVGREELAKLKDRVARVKKGK